MDKIEAKILWETDCYDGPICGICEFEGNKYYFDMFEEAEPFTDSEWYRRYHVYRLEDEVLAYEIESHKRFQRITNAHYNYRNDPKLQVFEPKEKLSDFYNWRGKFPDTRDSEKTLIGYFEY